VVQEWKQGGISGVCGAEVGLHYRNKSSSVQGVIQTCGDIVYKRVAQERVHNTKHESQEMGKGMRGLEGDWERDWEQRRDIGKGK